MLIPSNRMSSDPCVPLPNQPYSIQPFNSGLCLSFPYISVSDGNPGETASRTDSNTPNKPEASYQLSASPCGDNTKTWYINKIENTDNYYILRETASEHVMGIASTASGSSVYGVDPSRIQTRDGKQVYRIVWQIVVNTGSIAGSCSMLAVDGFPPNMSLDEPNPSTLSPTDQSLTFRITTGTFFGVVTNMTTSVIDTYHKEGAADQSMCLKL